MIRQLAPQFLLSVIKNEEPNGVSEFHPEDLETTKIETSRALVVENWTIELNPVNKLGTLSWILC